MDKSKLKSLSGVVDGLGMPSVLPTQPHARHSQLPFPYIFKYYSCIDRMSRAQLVTHKMRVRIQSTHPKIVSILKENLTLSLARWRPLVNKNLLLENAGMNDNSPFASIWVVILPLRRRLSVLVANITVSPNSYLYFKQCGPPIATSTCIMFELRQLGEFPYSGCYRARKLFIAR